MATYINFKDPNSPELDKLLADLPTCPGTCIFIDIVGSTDIKYRTEFKSWARMLNNTFNFITFLNDFPNHVVKGIGDELMLYIPDEDLRKKKTINNHYHLLEEIYATLHNIKNFPGSTMFLPCKVALHYCTDVYNITYFANYDDYYGRDIDLSARLMTKSRIHRIVFSEKFYNLVVNDARQLGLDTQQSCLTHVSEKFIEDFKGVPFATEFRIIDV
ncbi:MAG: adenylate/guanylate cyclase domain-containing protein [Bacteroidales bacterium]|nr:adenylate/guanylate cyclase domain-containing protein [Bacteroidales bacterium]